MIGHNASAVLLVAVTTLAATGATDAQAPLTDELGSGNSELVRPYTVECGPDPEEGGNLCLVDRGTYVGWRTFHATCHVCHAQDAVGSTFAPSLLDRMKEIDKERFMNSLENGYTGQVGVMPPWK